MESVIDDGWRPEGSEKFVEQKAPVGVELTREEVIEIIETYGCGGACGYMGCECEQTQMQLAQAYAYILHTQVGGTEDA